MGLIFKDDPNKEAKKKTKNAPPEPTIVVPPVVPFTPQNVTNMTGVADEKMVQILMDVIAKNNIPGQDYFEFKQTLDALASSGIPEATKYLTIFTTFKVQGCTKETLLSSIDKYVSVVKAEQVSFDAEMAAQKEAKINGKNSQIDDARKKIDEWNKQIEAINKQIAEANTFVITASQELQNEQLKLQMTETQFKSSVDKVVGMLMSDKEKINSFIQ